LPDPSAPRAFTLMLDGVPSSHVDLDDPEHLEFEYMQQMAAVLDRLAPAGAPIAAVHLGGAGCTLARYIHACRPGSRQLAVEIDELLARHVREWFELPRAPALRIRVGDAREVLATLPDASADVVVRDVFADAHTPAHVQTLEFTAEVARVLRPDGVYLANVADRPPLALARSEAATVAAVFGDLAVMAEPALLRGRRYGNVVLAATRSSEVLASADLARAVRSLPAPSRILVGAEAVGFTGRAPVLRDPEPADPPHAG